nr:DUF4265 domain-containing protein [uncultured Marinobacter sp.]
MSKIFQRGDYVAIHENPVWRDESDFIIRAYLEENKGRNEWEQLWAKRLDDRRFSLCCIPFFAYNLALGDEVETDGSYVVEGVVRPSGQFTFRIWFGESTRPESKGDVVRQLEAIGASLEWSSDNLLAVSAKGAAQTKEVADYLYSRQNAGDLIYETGRQ